MKKISRKNKIKKGFIKLILKDFERVSLYLKRED